MTPLLLALLLAKPVPTVVHLPVPAQARVEGCVRSSCTELGELRACKCLTDEGTFVAVSLHGRKVGAVSVNAYLGQTDDFEVSRGDLDGDGHAEVVVASRDSTSDGVAISRWTIAILDGRLLADGHADKSPVSFGVDDYGEGVVRRDGLLLLPEWQSERGGGLSLLGRPFRYERGALLPDARSPVMRRRLVQSFEEERNGDLGAGSRGLGRPGKWLSDGRCQGAGTDARGAVVERARIVGAGITNDRLMLVTRAGLKVRVLSASSGQGIRLGDIATGRLYPPGYRPADPDALSGRHATLAKSADGAESLVVWVE